MISHSYKLAQFCGINKTAEKIKQTDTHLTACLYDRWRDEI